MFLMEHLEVKNSELQFTIQREVDADRIAWTAGSLFTTSPRHAADHPSKWLRFSVAGSEASPLAPVLNIGYESFKNRFQLKDSVKDILNGTNYVWPLFQGEDEAVHTSSRPRTAQNSGRVGGNTIASDLYTTVAHRPSTITIMQRTTPANVGAGSWAEEVRAAEASTAAKSARPQRVLQSHLDSRPAGLQSPRSLRAEPGRTRSAPWADYQDDLRFDVFLEESLKKNPSQETKDANMKCVLEEVLSLLSSNPAIRGYSSVTVTRKGSVIPPELDMLDAKQWIDLGDRGGSEPRQLLLEKWGTPPSLEVNEPARWARRVTIAEALGEVLMMTKNAMTDWARLSIYTGESAAPRSRIREATEDAPTTIGQGESRPDALPCSIDPYSERTWVPAGGTYDGQPHSRAPTESVAYASNQARELQSYDPDGALSGHGSGQVPPFVQPHGHTGDQGDGQEANHAVNPDVDDAVSPVFAGESWADQMETEIQEAQGGEHSMQNSALARERLLPGQGGGRSDEVIPDAEGGEVSSETVFTQTPSQTDEKDDLQFHRRPDFGESATEIEGGRGESDADTVSVDESTYRITRRASLP